MYLAFAAIVIGPFLYRLWLRRTGAFTAQPPLIGGEMRFQHPLLTWLWTAVAIGWAIALFVTNMSDGTRPSVAVIQNSAIVIVLL